MTNYKYKVKYTSNYKKNIKKIIKQGKDIEKLLDVIDVLACGSRLDKKYLKHRLNDNKKYKNCYECHIEPDWLLIYQYSNLELILVLVDTGSHSDLF